MKTYHNLVVCVNKQADCGHVSEGRYNPRQLVIVWVFSAALIILTDTF